MSYRTMKLELSGFAPELSMIQIGLRLNHSYNYLFDFHPWSFKNKEVNFATVAPYTTGTMDVTQGSTAVVGHSTTWTAAMAGRFVKCGVGGVPFYQIASVGGVTSLTLSQNYTDSTALKQPYSIFQHRYSIPSDCGNITAIIYDSELPERTKNYLDVLDPERQSVGQPVWWCHFDNDTFELWPVPDRIYTCRISYQLAFTALSLETDVPLFSEWCIIQHARLMAYEQLSTTEDGSKRYTRDAIDKAREAFAEVWFAAVEDDMRKLSLPTKVVEDGIDFPQSNDYWMKHDPTDPRGSWS